MLAIIRKNLRGILGIIYIYIYSIFVYPNFNIIEELLEQPVFSVGKLRKDDYCKV